jgi:hypothetical protein
MWVGFGWNGSGSGLMVDFYGNGNEQSGVKIHWPAELLSCSWKTPYLGVISWICRSDRQYHKVGTDLRITSTHGIAGSNAHWCRLGADRRSNGDGNTILPDNLSPRSTTYSENIYWTHSQTSVLFENPSIVQLLKNFPIFYGTRRFITVFTRALHWSLSWGRSIQSISL